MKICINTSSFPKFKGDYAGAFVFELALSLLKKGHEVWVLCPAVKESPLSDNIDGINIVRYRYAWPAKNQIIIGDKPAVPLIQENKLLAFFVPMLMLCQLWALFRLVRHNKIDVVNSHWLIPQGVISAIVSVFCKVKHVSTLHSTDVYIAMKLPLAKYICRFVEKTALSTFISGSFVRERYNKILKYESASSIVPMGVNEEKFAGVMEYSPAPDKILFVGRLHKIKGINFLLEAFASLSNERPGLKLEIVGGGEELDNLRELAKTLSIEKNVTFSGFVASDKIAGYYASARCIVVPSLMLPSGETEGMPVVILESLICGTPVIASNVGGIKDVVKDSYNGFLVEAGNSKQIADAIRKILADSDYTLRKNAKESCRKYYWTNIGDIYLRGMTEKVVEDL